MLPLKVLLFSVIVPIAEQTTAIGGRVLADGAVGQGRRPEICQLRVELLLTVQLVRVIVP